MARKRIVTPETPPVRQEEEQEEDLFLIPESGNLHNYSSKKQTICTVQEDQELYIFVLKTFAAKMNLSQEMKSKIFALKIANIIIRDALLRCFYASKNNK